MSAAPSPNPARPPYGAVLIRLDDLRDGQARAVDFAVGDARWSVIVARSGARAFAYENRCPHAGLPLDRPDGEVTVDLLGFLVCAAHLASFRLEDGGFAGGPSGPGARGLTKVKVAVRDGLVMMA